MQVNFKFEMGEFVNMKIDKSKEEYMIVTLIHENGGNQYKIFSGESELIRNEFELEKIMPKKVTERKTGFKKHSNIQDCSGMETKGIQTDDE